MARRDMRHKSKEDIVFLEELFQNFCDPRELPRDGRIEKHDFVWRREGVGWIFFLKPKNPKRRPKTLHDGHPKFVKLSSSLKFFGRQGIVDYLSFIAQRHGLSIRKLKGKKDEEIWQFC